MSEAVDPFVIDVPEAVLDDLRERLARTRFPDQIAGSGWDYGTDRAYLAELCEYWRDKFDWRSHEALLNRFDHFVTDIDGQRLHFIHQRSPVAGALPLVITHGWPGSVFEFYKIIGPLTDPAAHGGRAEDAFWDVSEVASIAAKLMDRLGYDRYGAQGGDWGALVTAHLGALDPDHVCGIHMNMVVCGPPPDAENPMEGITPEEAADLASMGEFQQKETGYQQIQGTKPQTLGYALNDSPAGLAAWIVEKFRTWSDCDGDVERRFTKDELLTNIMIYWVTETINSSVRLYCESMRSGRFGPTGQRVEVPTAGAIFPKELIKPPRKWAEAHFDLRQWTRMESGGHFAALEEPEALVGDIRSFFAPLR
jgi:microsomal epoxide hydrolase